MPATVSSTVLGKHKSVVRATPMSTAGTASIDVLTVNHGLGASPDQIVAVLRTIRAGVSGGAPAVVLRSWSATSAIFHLEAALQAATAVDVDIVCEVTHSTVR